jgi:sorbitol-specific phosphotransferase system component IIBC
MNTIQLKKGEQKTLKITVTNKNTKKIISLTGCSLTLVMKLMSKNRESNIITKNDSDFDKSNVSEGIIRVLISSNDINTIGKYNCQLKIEFPNNDIDLSDIFEMNITDPL